MKGVKRNKKRSYRSNSDEENSTDDFQESPKAVTPRYMKKKPKLTTSAATTTSSESNPATSSQDPFQEAPKVSAPIVYERPLTPLQSVDQNRADEMVPDKLLKTADDEINEKNWAKILAEKSKNNQARVYVPNYNLHNYHLNKSLVVLPGVKWVPCVDSGDYAVSNFGRAASKDGIIKISNKKRGSDFLFDGGRVFICVVLSEKERLEEYGFTLRVKDDGTIPIMLDYLVLKCFDGVDPKKLHIIHDNFNFYNNCLTNLSWATHNKYWTHIEKENSSSTNQQQQVSRERVINSRHSAVVHKPYIIANAFHNHTKFYRMIDECGKITTTIKKGTAKKK